MATALPHPTTPAEAATAVSDRLRSLAWRGFAFTLPPGWEITAYDLGERHGRFELHHRLVARAVVSWRAFTGTPDLPRIIAESLKRHLVDVDPAEGARFTSASSRRVGEWVLGWNRPGDPAFALRWQPERQRLLQWVFPDYQPQAAGEQEINLLESYRANQGSERLWQLFGVGCSLPPEFDIEKLLPQPACVGLRFGSPQDLQVTVRRIGMLEPLPQENALIQAYRPFIVRDAGRLLRTEPVTILGHPGMRLEFDRRGQRRLEMLLGRWWPGEAVVWSVPDEGRLYAFEQWGPPATPRLEVAHAWR